MGADQLHILQLVEATTAGVRRYVTALATGLRARGMDVAVAATLEIPLGPILPGAPSYRGTRRESTTRTKRGVIFASVELARRLVLCPPTVESLSKHCAALRPGDHLGLPLQPTSVGCKCL